MPEFKVVVNDPEAKSAVPIPVTVEGNEELPYAEDHKEGRKLIEARINSKTYELIKSPYGIATLKILRPGEERKKINVTVRLVKDDNIPELTVQIPSAFLEEKVGGQKVSGELIRPKAFQITVAGEKAAAFLEKRIGDVVDASVIGLSGKKLLITGGSDNTGFPMLKTLPGGSKRRILLEAPPGFHPKENGGRRRKFVRGNLITEDIVQINTKLIEA